MGLLSSIRSWIPTRDNLVQAASTVVNRLPSSIRSRIPQVDAYVQAASNPFSGGLTDSIVAPKARDRFFELIEREQLPGDVRDTLAGALTGDMRRQQLLFQAMIDTWPRLQKNLAEIFREVKKAPWEFTAFSQRGQDADPTAVEKAELAEDAFWTMTPRIDRGEKGGRGVIEQLAYGYFAGHQVIEIRWDSNETGIVPRAGKVVPPRYYGYPFDNPDQDEEDRLMFLREGGLKGYDYEDFPKHHFLLAINGGHPGHATVAAPLRALTGYWLAATFGLKWLLRFAELYGVPFRWATYADNTSTDKVCEMLETIGSAGWGAFPAGTKVEFVDASKAAKDVPQRDLIDLADRQCDTFILGQTLTTDVGDSGSRALGDVHQGVRLDVMQGVTDFVADILNEQLLPSLIELNYGEAKEVPTIEAHFEKPKDEEAMARRDKELFVNLGLPVEKAWLYNRHGIPIPDPDSDDLFQPVSHGVQGEPATGGAKLPEEPLHETRARLEASDKSLTWREFPKGSGSLGIPRAEMPQIYSGNRSALVGFLKKRGISTAKDTVDADTLSPTQRDFSPEKVKASEEFKGGSRSILVSSDGHVVDGHHQWLAALNKGEKIPVLRLGAPIVRLLNLAHQMPSTKVAAKDALEISRALENAPSRMQNNPLIQSSEGIQSTIDQLSANVLEDLTGVTKEWLSPVRPFFERLAALAMSKNVTDEDFAEALGKAQQELPELFDRFNTEVLQESLERAIGSAMIAGSVQRYEGESDD